MTPGRAAQPTPVATTRVAKGSTSAGTSLLPYHPRPMTLHRVATVFRKELADVLRDRRTLIATVIIPVVLYPLLMLLSIQAVSIQVTTVAAERITLGVTDDRQLAALEALLREEGDALTAEQTPLADVADVVVVDDLRRAVMDRVVHVGITLAADEGEPDLTRQLSVRLVLQPEDLRSQTAASRVQTMLNRVGRARVDERLAEVGVPRRAIEPVVVEQTRLTTPGTLLSLIVPTLLVLMTITSAIYPAIDVTAGEHERGTLESLLVCPVPVLDLVTGKFLTVATIGMLGALLNLTSVAATAYFGGLGELLAAGQPDANGADAPGGASGAASGGGFPWLALPIILVSLIPFSVLMSAVLIAVCGCARSFKEAQNYVTPVIIASLMPAMIASLPGVRLEGLMLVLPIGNMVLLVRELLSGAPVPASSMLLVLASTTAYAAAAVGVAAQTFGKETVMFADSVSLRSLLSRHVARPRRLPSFTLAALYTAALFPAWFYLQTLLQQVAAGDFVAVLRHTAVFMPLLFVVVPAAMLWYWKVDLRATFLLQLPTPRHLIAGVLFGLALWVVAHEVFVFQQLILPTPEALADMAGPLEEAIRQQPLWLLLVLLAVVPAVSEELFFRGYLQNGLSTSLRKWVTLIAVAAVFALFHFFVFRFATTFALGLVLGWLCWQSRSIWPAVVAHAIHNGQAVVSARFPAWRETLGVPITDDISHLPWVVLLMGTLVLLVAVALSARPAPDPAGRDAA
jgi:sodium transport system permease protein